VISVGASDSNDTLETADDTVASFSSYGVTADGFLKPEIVATGRHIVSNLVTGSLLDYMAPAANHVEPGYLMANGTSFSAPQVAGGAAILLQANPSLSPSQVKWLLAATGRPVNGSNAPGLDLASALAYTGAVQSANQGIAYSTGPAGAVTGSGTLNSGAAKDATAYERAAVKYEASSAWNNAADAWQHAGDSWAGIAAFVSAAIDYDTAGRDYALGGAFDKAAAAWKRAGDAVVRASLPEWQPVALEFSARAWMAKGKYDTAAQTMELAAARWVRPPIDL
jgi:subtilisin family serine protease